MWRLKQNKETALCRLTTPIQSQALYHFKIAMYGLCLMEQALNPIKSGWLLL